MKIADISVGQCATVLSIFFFCAIEGIRTPNHIRPPRHFKILESKLNIIIL